MSFYSISESERKKIYYKYNRDWILEYGKIWRKNHPEYHKIWYQKHPEYNKKYYHYNRERLLKTAKEHYRNRELVLKKKKMNATLRRLMKKVKAYFWKLENPHDISCGTYVSEIGLKDVISKVKDIHDHSSINKWIKRLIEFRFIIIRWQTSHLKEYKQYNQFKILNDGVL